MNNQTGSYESGALMGIFGALMGLGCFVLVLLALFALVPIIILAIIF